MLLAEDLLLLLTEDDSGKLVVSGAGVDLALGGALLMELTLDGRVDLTSEDEGKPGRLVVRDAGPAGDQLLDEALQVVAAKSGKKPSAAVGPLGRKLRTRLYGRLVERGVLRGEQGRVLGIFPSHRWPAQDAGHERDVRSRLEAALVHGLTPDPPTAALVSLLSALRAVPKVIDPAAAGVPKKQLDRRAKEIAEGDWGSAAVRSAIDAMNAAVTASIVAATTAATTSG